MSGTNDLLLLALARADRTGQLARTHAEAAKAIRDKAGCADPSSVLGLDVQHTSAQMIAGELAMLSAALRSLIDPQA